MATPTSVKYEDFRMPRTWRGRMLALVSGAIDYDDMETLALECAEVVDAANATKTAVAGIVMPDCWQAVVPHLIAELMQEQPADCLAAQLLLKCGEAADAVETISA